MSMFGSVAKSGYVDELLKFIKENRDKPAQEQVELIEKKLEENKKWFDSGWD